MQLEFSHILKVFIKSLEALNIVKKVYKVKYKGKGVSVNDYYSSGHWNKRAAIKNAYKKIFHPLIKSTFKSDIISTYCVVVFYNNNYDVDNVVGIEKIFVDELRGLGVTANDTKKYFKALIISEDSSLEKGTFEFLVCKFS